MNIAVHCMRHCTIVPDLVLRVFSDQVAWTSGFWFWIYSFDAVTWTLCLSGWTEEHSRGGACRAAQVHFWRPAGWGGLWPRSGGDIQGNSHRLCWGKIYFFIPIQRCVRIIMVEDKYYNPYFRLKLITDNFAIMWNRSWSSAEFFWSFSPFFNKEVVEPAAFTFNFRFCNKATVLNKYLCRVHKTGIALTEPPNPCLHFCGSSYPTSEPKIIEMRGGEYVLSDPPMIFAKKCTFYYINIYIKILEVTCI